MTTWQLLNGALVRMWAATATVSSGTAVFYPTTTGDASGTALFAKVESVHLTAELNTALPTAMPIASLKSISADRTTITVNCLTGTVLGILGATLLAAPDGTIVHCLAIGQ